MVKCAMVGEVVLVLVCDIEICIVGGDGQGDRVNAAGVGRRRSLAQAPDSESTAKISICPLLEVPEPAELATKRSRW